MFSSRYPIYLGLGLIMATKSWAHQEGEYIHIHTAVEGKRLIEEASKKKSDPAQDLYLTNLIGQIIHDPNLDPNIKKELLPELVKLSKLIKQPSILLTAQTSLTYGYLNYASVESAENYVNQANSPNLIHLFHVLIADKLLADNQVEAVVQLLKRNDFKEDILPIQIKMIQHFLSKKNYEKAKDLAMQLEDPAAIRDIVEAMLYNQADLNQTIKITKEVLNTPEKFEIHGGLLACLYVASGNEKEAENIVNQLKTATSKRWAKIQQARGYAYSANVSKLTGAIKRLKREYPDISPEELDQLLLTFIQKSTNPRHIQKMQELIQAIPTTSQEG